MLKVYFFFVIFLFFAQMIYVSQFFHILLLNELFFLPDFKSNSFFKNLKRILFITPISNEASKSTVYFNGGDTIFAADDDSDSVFYICQGFVCIEEEKEGAKKETLDSKNASDSSKRDASNTSLSSRPKPNVRLMNMGNFFGESSCILGKKRGSTARALTMCKLIVVSKKDFMSILQANPKAAAKAMEIIKEEV